VALLGKASWQCSVDLEDGRINSLRSLDLDGVLYKENQLAIANAFFISDSFKSKLYTFRNKKTS